MKIVFLNVQTANEKWSNSACDAYIEKLKHFHKIEIKTVKSEKNSRENAKLKKDKDSAAILNELNGDDYVFLFDEKGKKLNSLEYAQKVQQGLSSGKKRMVFIIGGAFGVNADVFEKAHVVVNLSTMTMNHIVAQVMMLEQTYRAFTILHHLPYHNE